ncbi:MAG: hypothetical protein AAGN82_11350 [Myxococcota bacterium]
MRCRWRAGLVVGLVSAMFASPTSAKSHHKSPYTYRQTFGSAVRLLKVDLGLTVTEKDPDWGYVLFAYTSPESGDRESEGSFSFVEKEGTVSVTLQIPKMPSYHEQVILDRLQRKLKEEHGEPPRREAEDKDEAPKDGDGENDDDDDDDAAASDDDRTAKRRARRGRS